jgi:transposase
VGSRQKGAVAEGRTIVWVDESGFYLLPALVKTWAPRGAARRGLLPTLSVPLTRAHLSVISAVTEDLRLLSRTWDGAINGKRIVAFLQHLLRQVRGKVLVVWDGAPIHRCKEVKRFLADGAAQRLQLLALPGYAPDLNPDEGVWRWLKRVALGNVCCDTLDELRSELRLAFARLRHRKDVLAACIQRPGYIQ